MRQMVAWILLAGGLMSAAQAHEQPVQPRARLPLEVLPDTLAICRLAPDTALPAWASAPAPFLTVSRTPDELSITALQSLVPEGVRCERDYRALRVRGSLPPNLVGILLSIAEPLAAAGLSIFAISTYETDYVLLKASEVAAGVKALRKAGHRVST